MKKLLSIFLSIAVAAGLFTVPAGVYAEEQTTNDLVVIDSMDYAGIWQSSSDAVTNTTDNMEGTGCLEVTGADINLLLSKKIDVEGGIKAKNTLKCGSTARMPLLSQVTVWS